MDKYLLQRLVHHRITERRLPLGRAVGIHQMWGDGRPCDACEAVMDRRAFITLMGGSIFAVPPVAQGQRAGKAHHIGFLPAGSSTAHQQ
jgi:hypothetical protein